MERFFVPQPGNRQPEFRNATYGSIANLSAKQLKKVRKNQLIGRLEIEATNQLFWEFCGRPRVGDGRRSKGFPSNSKFLPNIFAMNSQRIKIRATYMLGLVFHLGEVQ